MSRIAYLREDAGWPVCRAASPQRPRSKSGTTREGRRKALGQDGLELFGVPCGVDFLEHAVDHEGWHGGEMNGWLPSEVEDAPGRGKDSGEARHTFYHVYEGGARCNTLEAEPRASSVRRRGVYPIQISQV